MSIAIISLIAFISMVALLSSEEKSIRLETAELVLLIEKLEHQNAMAGFTPKPQTTLKATPQ